MAECKGKDSWPELVGVNGEYAEKVIEKENPYVDAILVKEGSVVPLDFRCDRVWVWVDKYQVVTREPRIG